MQFYFYKYFSFKFLIPYNVGSISRPIQSKYVTRLITINDCFVLAPSRGDESICDCGPLCQLPLRKRAAQLFSHTMTPVKNEKNCSSTETNNKRK